MTVEVPSSLIEKYNKAGPRYTSYPTVPVWTDTFNQEDYLSALAGFSARPDEEISLYLHLPFCVKKCDYCGCNSEPAPDRSAVDDYLDRVEKEIGIVTEQLGKSRRVVQMHWGGGTPNYLDERQLQRAMDLLRCAFDLDFNGEISLEVDPRLGNPQQMELLRSLGFNRISLGVQDFDPAVQKAIGRIQPETRTRSVLAACRDAGFTSVNIDMVYGLPGQTKESFERTLGCVIDLDPDRIACFGYAHVPWVRTNQKRVDTSEMPGPHEKFELFRTAVDLFARAGYEWIGLDHFARLDDELSAAYRRRRLHRNFMGYTTRPDLKMIAFGMSGISDLGDCFAQNNARLNEYMTDLDDGRLPIVRGHKLTRDDLVRRTAILNLMCNLELPFDLIRETSGVTIEEALAPELNRMRIYEKEGFLVFHEDRIRVTELGRFFIRNICMELDAYLKDTRDKQIFSRTI
ncbi:MAG: oxygen-independent coproporphyrinogen III oxidase [Planctomycetota bacterium]|jgi:oxygen-independent coproporphyrinogen-3 oxidase